MTTYAFSKPTRTAWVVCLSAGLFFFYEFFQLNFFDVANNDLRTSFAADASDLSLLSSTFLWADILFLLPAGMIFDRYSAKKTILITMFLCVLGTFGFALAHSFYLAAVFRFIAGIGNAFCFLACVVLTSRWFAPNKQALVIGIIVTMAFIGGMMAHTPLSYLNAHFGWRTALLIDGGLGLIILAWLYYALQDYPGSISKHKVLSINELLKSLKITSISKQNLLAGAYTSLLNLPILVLCALWGVSYLRIAYSLSDIEASNMVSLIYVGSIIGCPLIGFCSDKMLKRKPLMLYSGILSLAAVLILLFVPHLTKISLSLIFFAIGFFTSSQIISYPLIAESNLPQNTGVATAVASIIIMGGGAIAQVLFGLLLEHNAGVWTINYSIEDYNFAMLLFPIAILLGILTLIGIRETNCKNIEQNRV